LVPVEIMNSQPSGPRKVRRLHKKKSQRTWRKGEALSDCTDALQSGIFTTAITEFVDEPGRREKKDKSNPCWYWQKKETQETVPN